MPTYSFKITGLKISNKKKKYIAKQVTNIHSKNTGANTYFAQVFFNKIKMDDHFMAGKEVKEKKIFLHGHIRAGRTDKIKKKLIRDFKKLLIKETRLDSSQIWIYITDLPPQQMLEYGEILPLSGKEKIWFSGLSPKLKKKLITLER